MKEAGYTNSEIKSAIFALRQNNNEDNHDHQYGRDRPKTHVFTQGKVFTYEKLEVPKKILRKKKLTQVSENWCGSTMEGDSSDGILNMHMILTQEIVFPELMIWFVSKA